MSIPKIETEGRNVHTPSSSAHTMTEEKYQSLLELVHICQVKQFESFDAQHPALRAILNRHPITMSDLYEVVSNNPDVPFSRLIEAISNMKDFDSVTEDSPIPTRRRNKYKSKVPSTY